MKIREYIEKYDLTIIRKEPSFDINRGAISGILLPDDTSLHEDVVEIYSNLERTIWVSLNLTRNKFRICHNEMFMMYSDWNLIDCDYISDKLLSE